MAKSILHMIVGTLVDDDRLNPDQLAPVPSGVTTPILATRSKCATS